VSRKIAAESWLDPSSTSNPFWDLAGGLSSPQAVALGNDGAPIIVVAEPTRVFRVQLGWFHFPELTASRIVDERMTNESDARVSIPAASTTSNAACLTHKHRFT
jgi:hypothetical protein